MVRKMSKRDAGHVIINMIHGRLECLHCGETQGLAFPVRVEMLVAMSATFRKLHVKCPRPKEGERCVRCGQSGHERQVCTS